MPTTEPSENDRQRRAILVAGEAVITERGFARATAAEVAARAGVSVESFHLHFQGMGALLRALSKGFVAQMHTVTNDATRSGIWKGAAAKDVIEVAVRTILDVVIEKKGLVRAFLAHGATDPSLSGDLRSIGANLADRLVTVLGECRDVPVKPRRGVAFSLLLTVALAHHYILVGDEWSGVSFSPAELAEEMARVICAYLGLGPTINFRGEVPDGAPTGAVRAVDMDETGEMASVKPR